MEVDLETRECLESTDKSTSTGAAVFFLTLAFIAGCFIGVIVYSNMTSEQGQREYKIWGASIKNSQKAREKYYKAIDLEKSCISKYKKVLEEYGLPNLDIDKIDKIDKIVADCIQGREKIVRDWEKIVRGWEKIVRDGEEDVRVKEELARAKQEVARAKEEVVRYREELAVIGAKEELVRASEEVERASEEVERASEELARAKQEECIALENFKIFRGAVNQS